MCVGRKKMRKSKCVHCVLMFNPYPKDEDKPEWFWGCDIESWDELTRCSPGWCLDYRRDRGKERSVR